MPAVPHDVRLTRTKIPIAIDTAVCEFVSRGLTNAGQEFLVPEDELQSLDAMDSPSLIQR